VKPVGVLGVRGLRGATRLAAAAHALERSFSVLAGVASEKVTRAVTVRMPPPSGTSASNGALLRVAMTWLPTEKTTRRMSRPVTTARNERSTQRLVP
jgi:hypothetical protein